MMKMDSCLVRFCHINRSLLPVKVTYFILFAAIAVLLPFIPVYMRQLGLSPAESAIILSITTALTGIVRAIVGIVADKLNRHRLIMFLCCIFGGIFHFCIMFAPPESSRSNHSVLDSVNRTICCSSSNNALKLSLLCDHSADGYTWSSFSSSHFNSSQNLLIFALDDLLLNEKKLMNQIKNCSLSCSCKPDEKFPNLNNHSTYKEKNHTTVKSLSSSCDQFSNILFSVSHSSDNCSNGSDLECIGRSESHLVVNLDLVEFCGLADEGLCHLMCENPSDTMPPVNVTDQLSPKFQHTFIIVFILFFFGQSAFTPIFNLLDGIVYNYLGDQRGEYGKQRLWGTVGFGLFAIKSSVIVDILSRSGADNSYLYSFIAFFLLCFITGFMVCFFKSSPEPSMESSLHKNVRLLFCNFYLNILFVVMLIAGLLAGVQECFFFWFLKNLGADQLLLGVALLISCTTETIILFFSGKLISKFGCNVCLYLVFFVFSIRFLVNSFIENPWLALLPEASQCICFGLLYPTVTSWGSRLTPPGMQGTVQSFLGAMYLSIGRAFGAALGGAFFEAHGPRIMFRVFACVSFSFLILLIIILEVMKRKYQGASPAAEDKEEQKVEEEGMTKEDVIVDNINHDIKADGFPTNTRQLLSCAVSEGTSKEMVSLVDGCKMQP